MDLPGDISNGNQDDIDSSEESSNEHEQDSNTNNQPPIPDNLLPSVRQTAHDDQQFSDVQHNTNEQSNELAVRQPDHHGSQTNQESRNVWYGCQFELMQLVLNIGLFWQWLVSVLAAIAISIFGFSNRNKHGKNSYSLMPIELSDIFMVIFMLFATIIILTHTPLDTEITHIHDLVMPDHVNNTDEILPTNSGSSDINENAETYDSFDGDLTNRFSYDEPNVQAIFRESVPSAAVDDRTYDANSSHDSDEENEHILASESNYDADDEAGTDTDSNNGHSTNSKRDLISNKNGNVIFESNLDIDGEDDQSDDSDGSSIITHITDNWSEGTNVSTDSDYETGSEIDDLIDDDSEHRVMEVQNNLPLEQEISTAEQLFTIGKDTVTLVDPERQEIAFSADPTDIDGVKKPSSIDLNNDFIEERALSSGADGRTRDLNPVFSAGTQVHKDSNPVRHGDGEQTVGSNNQLPASDQNDRLITNINQPGQMVTSTELLLNDFQSNAQSDEFISTTDGQSTTQTFPSDASPDQTLQIEQKAVDQHEADHQAMTSSNRPMNMHFQRKSDPMVDPDEESLKQNTE